MTEQTRVVVVDDHPMVAEGIEAILEGYDDINVLATLSDGQALIDQLDDLAPDVVLMDLNMPGLNGLSATEIVREQRPETRVLVLSMHDTPEYITTAMSHGARCRAEVSTGSAAAGGTGTAAAGAASGARRFDRRRQASAALR